MRRLVPAVLLLVGACTTPSDAESGHAMASGERPAVNQPGGAERQGDSFASMSQQYIPRSGPYSATGASAWVPSAPAPAFVASGPPPPADPPAPDLLAAAASRPAAAPASEVARPEAAAPDAPDPALRTAGLALFNSASCGTCHAFADAGATGAIGPSLDRNSWLDKAHAIDVITTGRGAMPSFAGQLSDAEIAALADYLAAYSRK
jgi:mono/diheme cytochrome c family protein